MTTVLPCHTGNRIRKSSPRAMYFGDAPAMDEEGYSDLMHFLLKEGLKKLDCRKE